MDLSDKGSDCEGMSCHAAAITYRVSSRSSNVKTCADCGTSKTPLWRGGPDGPKSLCNACGIRSRKRRRALMGVTKEDKKNKNRSPLMKKLWAFGREYVGLQRPRSNTTRRRRRRRKLGEVEKAAFLLMALSCGSVYA